MAQREAAARAKAKAEDAERAAAAREKPCGNPRHRRDVCSMAWRCGSARPRRRQVHRTHWSTRTGEAAERKRAEAAKKAPPVVDETKPAPVKFVKSKKRSADETTRQRNKRKEGLGQAKFTLKEDRDCPSLWDGGGR